MTTIVGSGTGANYPVVAGALCRLETDGLVPTRFISTSGSCLSMAVRANGKSMIEFLALAKKHPPMTLIKPHWGWPLVPGLFHLDAVRQFMAPHVAKTFADNKISHTVLAFDSDSKSELMFSTELTPKADVALAVQASMSIPWLMRHTNIGGIRATDGGIVHNFAIDLPDEPAVGIRVLGSPSQGHPWRWWGSYSWNHVDGMMRALEREHVEDGLWKKHKIITVTSPISGMDFHLVNAETLEKLFNIGYEFVGKKLAVGWTWH